MTLPEQITTRERNKFGEKSSGQVAVHVIGTIDNESGNPVIVSGSTAVAAPTGPIKRLVHTVTAIAIDPIATPLSNRVSLTILNLSATVTVFIGEDNTITADNSATGGYDIPPQGEFSLDLDDSNNFFLIAPTGQTAIVKILEISSTGGSSGGGGSLTQVQEVPVGTVNGVNTSFALTQTPFNAQHFTLYLDGVLLRSGTHFTRSGTSITMITAPDFGQTLDAVFWVS